MQLQRLLGSILFCAAHLVALATAWDIGHDAAARCVSSTYIDEMALLTVCPVL